MDEREPKITRFSRMRVIYMGNLLQIEVPEFRDTYLNNLYSKRYREFRQNFYLLKRLPSKLVWKVVDKRNLIITLYKRKKVKYGAG